MAPHRLAIRDVIVTALERLWPPSWWLARVAADDGRDFVGKGAVLFGDRDERGILRQIGEEVSRVLGAGQTGKPTNERRHATLDRPARSLGIAEVDARIMKRLESGRFVEQAGSATFDEIRGLAGELEGARRGPRPPFGLSPQPERYREHVVVAARSVRFGCGPEEHPGS